MKRIALFFLALGACESDATTTARATFEPCFDAYECTTVSVPIDWSKPDGAKLGIRVVRAPAKDPARRLGAVVVNPGGPGIPYVDRLPSQYPLLGLAFAEATARFDVVTFDWRGVGRSARIDCVDDATLDRLRSIDLTLRTPEAERQTADLARDIRTGCAAKNDPGLLSRVHTEYAARDLDAIRAALGEERLDYLGFSYGSWLGATYATLFPDRVGSFVFDATVSLSADLEGDIERHAKTYELGLDRFFAACGATCTSQADPTPGAWYDAFMARLPIPAGARTLSYVDAQLAITDGLRSGDFPKLAKDLAAANAGDGTALVARADVVTGRDAAGHYDSSIVGLLTIACLDQPLRGAIGPFATELRARHPRTAALALVPWALCEAWPYAAPRLAIEAKRAPPMLLVSGRYDPITSHDQGAALAASLGNGSHLLTYEGDGHASSLRSTCVRDVVSAFLIDPKSPPTKTSCPAE